MFEIYIFKNSNEFTIYEDIFNMSVYNQLNTTIKELYEKLANTSKKNIKCVVSDNIPEFSLDYTYKLIWEKEMFAMSIMNVNQISYTYNKSENKYYTFITYDTVYKSEKGYNTKEFERELSIAKSIKRNNKIDEINK